MSIHRLKASAPYPRVGLIARDKTVEAVAMIDTGASLTAVHPDLIRGLEPMSIGYLDMGRIGEVPRLVATYLVELWLETDARHFAVEVVAVAPASPCQILIGGDLLCRWVLSWDGPGDQLLISY